MKYRGSSQLRLNFSSSCNKFRRLQLATNTVNTHTLDFYTHNRKLYWEPSPTFWEPSTTFCEPSPTFCKPSPTFCEPSPTFWEPSVPTFCELHQRCENLQYQRSVNFTNVLRTFTNVLWTSPTFWEPSPTLNVLLRHTDTHLLQIQCTHTTSTMWFTDTDWIF